MSNSATGGYLQPAPNQPFPNGLTLSQFIQTVLVGVSGLDGTLVRPKWQPEQPVQPDIKTNWLAFGISKVTPDANAFVGQDDLGNNLTIRHEKLEIDCTYYGPNSVEQSDIVREGFQIQQNLAAMLSVKMSFIDYSEAIRMPELINERWFERLDAKLTLVRMVQRVYPILSFISANGTLTAQNAGGQNMTLPIATGS